MKLSWSYNSFIESCAGRRTKTKILISGVKNISLEDILVITKTEISKLLRKAVLEQHHPNRTKQL